MASQQEIRDALRERLADPTISSDTFAELQRRIDAIKDDE
jgi:hypothetical protein